MYGETVMEHFENPRNVGEIKNADAETEAGNPACGDSMKIFIKIRDGAIEDIKFKTFGCGAAIASSSIATEMAKGKKLEEVLKISSKDIVGALGGLPSQKIHCSVMAAEALKKAVEKYKRKNAYHSG